ncbi:hypothetical protein [Acidithiobacillus thiooxidans]|jgi:hypothetical protein|uniref:Uncharacterized protein n=1 Tax=Acidithiobacillus thiooxidans ATCC 19377 TaxID=637390 RepID=A0A543PZE4_ACITH|nr:hypothetical protein [Acidithiobacillus thiooxidans]MDX5936457.1 hypothetical protein [Acidithiobacillus thiooxidans]TQN49442.1 hypothetical protein DLNHIDIE_03296 [Acidithiobacillus thiooxidans ATCC 19377]
MIITAADHAEGLQNRINRIRVMVRLLTTDSAYNELGKNDLAYALDAVENALEDACNCSGALTEMVTHAKP